MTDSLANSETGFRDLDLAHSALEWREPGIWFSRSQATVSYPAHGNAASLALEDHSFWFRHRNRCLVSLVRRFAPCGMFLDVGGGNGYQLQFLQAGVFKKLNLVSAMCEPGVEGCANASGRGVRNVYHCDFQSFPIEQYNIGGIGLFDVIEHIEHDSLFLLGIMARCPSGTRFYITVPALGWLWSSTDRYAQHFRRYDRSEFKRIIRETGLRPVYATYFFSYFAPFVFFLRVLREKVGKPLTTDEIVTREGRFHRKGKRDMNKVLNFFHKLEMGLVRAAARIPFGTSMLMVLEKK